MGWLSTLSPWLMAGTQSQSPIPGVPITPFNPNLPPEGAGGMTPPFVTQPSLPAKTPGQMGPQGTPPGGWLARLGEVPNNSLFQLGMSLLGNARGSNWQGVGQDARAIGQQQMLRRRLENEERRQKATDVREERVFNRQTGEWERQDRQRQSLDEFIATLPAAQQAAARANPEATHQAYMEAQAAANAPITPYQQQQLDLARRGLGIDYMNAQANIARANMERPLRGPDATLMNNVREAADRANALMTLGGAFIQQNSRTGTGPETAYNPFYGWQPGAQNMNSIVSQMIPFMRAPGSGATSDYEQMLYQRGVQSTQNSPQANMAIYRNQQTLAQIAQARRDFMEQWADDHGNLNGAEAAFQRSPEFQNLRRSNPIERERRPQRAQRDVTEMSDEELRRIAAGR